MWKVSEDLFCFGIGACLAIVSLVILAFDHGKLAAFVAGGSFTWYVLGGLCVWAAKTGMMPSPGGKDVDALR